MPSTGLKSSTQLRFEHPKLYNVIFHNDDFTPMDFVVWLLVSIFNYNENNAVQKMLQIHNSDEAVIGTYVYDIAETLRNRSIDAAREDGYPLNISLKEVN